MRAISLWQPWATAVALGSKRIETRSWRTTYRGPLAIHAARRCRRDEMIETAATWNWCGALQRQMGAREALWETLPFGAIVALVDLVDCRPTDTCTVAELDTLREWTSPAYAWCERWLGDFSPGRFAWILENVQPLEAPVATRGWQGLWTVDRGIEDAVLASANRLPVLG